MEIQQIETHSSLAGMKVLYAVATAMHTRKTEDAGADGVYMGTPLLVSRESDAHPNIKMFIVKAEYACVVSLYDTFSHNLLSLISLSKEPKKLTNTCHTYNDYRKSG